MCVIVYASFARGKPGDILANCQERSLSTDLWMQELAASAAQHVQAGLVGQLQALGLNLPNSSGLASARASSSVSNSRSGSIKPSRSTKWLRPQGMSTGSIGPQWLQNSIIVCECVVLSQS